MILCVLNSQNYETVLGTPASPTGYPLVFVAQKPDCSSFLVLVESLHVALTETLAVPDGYDFTYCQAWGLAVNDTVVARVVSDVQNKKRKNVDAHCSGVLEAGFNYAGNIYQNSVDAQNNIGIRAIYAGWSIQDPTTFPWVEPYSLGWWDVSNVWHAMTAAEFMLFAKAVSDYVSACAACCRNHKNAITQENCITYDYTTGWPVNPQ